MQTRFLSCLGFRALVVFLCIASFSWPSQQQSFPGILNPRLFQAYAALQAWKIAMVSDPGGFTSNWVGFDVCSYNGISCAAAPDDPLKTTVAGIDLNHANISGFLPPELGLLADLAFFHINSNRFCGTVPDTFRNLRLLYELDLSNNHLSGPFPPVLLFLPSLKYLDIRFNGFEGELPCGLFEMKLDALFINNNRFRSSLPQNLGNSPVSVMVLANNDLSGPLPSSIGNMAGTLNEIILLNTGLKGCLPQEIGSLQNVTVFDVSLNELAGTLPESVGQMKSLEQLNVADNQLSGLIPASLCSLPNLQNFTYSNNFFSGEPSACLQLPSADDRQNCIPNRPFQRSPRECAAFYAHPVDCAAVRCSAGDAPPLS